MPVASGLKILDYLAQKASQSLAFRRVHAAHGRFIGIAHDIGHPPWSRTVQLRCRASTFWFVSKLNMSIGEKFNTDKIELRLFR